MSEEIVEVSEEAGIEDTGVEEEVHEEEIGEEEEQEVGTKITDYTDLSQYPEEVRDAIKKSWADRDRKITELSGKAELAKLIEENPERALELLKDKIPDRGEETEDLSDSEVWARQQAEKVFEKMFGEKIGQFEQRVLQIEVQKAYDYLDSKYDDWTQYEDRMIELIKKHPSLGQDLDSLYVLAKGEHKQVDQIVKEGGKQVKVATKSSKGKGDKVPPRAGSIEEAIELAKRKHNIK